MNNTNKIILQTGTGVTYAAGLARAYNAGGYTDWYLPSQDELYKLYLNRNKSGITPVDTIFGDPYWSSSESSGDSDLAIIVNLLTGYKSNLAITLPVTSIYSNGHD